MEELLQKYRKAVTVMDDDDDDDDDSSDSDSDSDSDSSSSDSSSESKAPPPPPPKRSSSQTKKRGKHGPLPFLGSTIVLNRHPSAAHGSGGKPPAPLVVGNHRHRGPASTGLAAVPLGVILEVEC